MTIRGYEESATIFEQVEDESVRKLMEAALMIVLFDEDLDISNSDVEVDIPTFMAILQKLFQKKHLLEAAVKDDWSSVGWDWPEDL